MIADSTHAPVERLSAAPRLSLPRRAYAALLRRLMRWFDLRLVWIFRRILVGSTSAPHGEPGYSFRQLSAAEMLDAAADPLLELSRERIEEAAASGDLFFGALQQDRVVSYRWYSVSGATPCWEGMQIRYAAPKRAYGYRVFTHPAHRGKHLYEYTARQSDLALIARGCTHTIAYIDATNFASLRAYSHLLSGRRVGGILSFRAFGRHWVFRSSGAIRHAVTIVSV